jgi:hypothetical protein
MPRDAPDFSAAPSALGYLHQVRYALVLLLQARAPDTVISIEKIDDVAFEDATSVFTDLIHRSQWAFKFGLRGGSSIGSIPTDLRTPSNAAQNLVSRSCNRYRQPDKKPTSAWVMLRAICCIHPESAEVVIPAMHTFRDATRMKVSTK